jgi:hypothetical protein
LGISPTVFITKLNPAGSSLVYSTFIGIGEGYSISNDTAGNAYLTVEAGSIYPVTPGAY